MEGIQVKLLLCTAVLIGLDCKVSWMRWMKFGPQVELNPLVRKILQSQGLQAGLACLLLLNLAILALLSHSTIPLAILLGAKLGLAILQIKSLEYK